MPEEKGAARLWIARAFTLIEDIVYIGLGLLLAGSAVALLIWNGVSFVRGLGDPGNLPTSIVSLLDGMLLVLLIVELLYTVQVSFREHSIVPEPFLLVGVIAGIRRVLVLTAEMKGVERSPSTFQQFIIELGALTVLILVLVISLLLLRKHQQISADRA